MITLTPAYGRDYKSKAEVLAGVKANKDFVLNDASSQWNGQYCSPSDFKGQNIIFRYAKLRKTMTVKI